MSIPADVAVLTGAREDEAFALLDTALPSGLLLVGGDRDTDSATNSSARR